MKPKTYAEKLRDPRWQKKRLEVFNHFKWKCEICHDSENELHAHHIAYKKNANPWSYNPWELACLCSNCHKLIHERKKANETSAWDELTCRIQRFEIDVDIDSQENFEYREYFWHTSNAYNRNMEEFEKLMKEAVIFDPSTWPWRKAQKLEVEA